MIYSLIIASVSQKWVRYAFLVPNAGTIVIIGIGPHLLR